MRRNALGLRHAGRVNRAAADGAYRLRGGSLCGAPLSVALPCVVVLCAKVVGSSLARISARSVIRSGRGLRALDARRSCASRFLRRTDRHAHQNKCDDQPEHHPAADNCAHLRIVVADMTEQKEWMCDMVER